MSTELFYTQLPALENLCNIITNPDSFAPVPSDWLVVITDVVGSTQAIKAGRYKDVNLLGACSIIAILNIAQDLDIPFIFGGDGASLLIPPSLLSQTRQVLLSTQKFAQQEFQLDLRVGIVPLSSIQKANYSIEVAKSKISKKYDQAVFNGGGIAYAEQLVKDPSTSKKYSVKEELIYCEADFSGLVCPWQDVPNPYGEIVSLIVKALSRDSKQRNCTYRGLIENLEKIYRKTGKLNPITPENLAITLNNKNLASAAKIQAKSSSLNWPFLHFWKQKAKSSLAKLKIRLDSQFSKRLKNNIVADTDYMKFDDTFRMVLAANQEQQTDLINYLEQNYQRGKLVYGVHRADRALMTCLVSKEKGRHVAFIDGADGGYALAAKAMKERAAIVTSLN